MLHHLSPSLSLPLHSLLLLCPPASLCAQVTKVERVAIQFLFDCLDAPTRPGIAAAQAKAQDSLAALSSVAALAVGKGKGKKKGGSSGSGGGGFGGGSSGGSKGFGAKRK